jgi:MtaA/CmuA family methyltransferase
MTSRERVLAMLDGRPVDHLPLMPITMMFAADRIGEKYGRYALDHRIMAEAQIRTAGEFGFDHVSAITETREAPDCGASVQYFDDQPYAMDESRARLAEKSVLKDLKMPEPRGGGAMHDRLLGLALMKERAGRDKIVEGWVEGPCGASADLRGINTLMLDFFDDRPFVTDLFEFVVELAIRFGRAQVEAGADVVGIGDPASSLVGPRIYEELVWPYQKRLTDGLRAAGARVRLHICGNTRRMLEGMARLGCDIVDIDSQVPLAEAREKMGPNQVLLGNLDPVRVLRDATAETVFGALAECHRQAGPRYIVAAGCEVVRDTPLANMRALVEYARSH